VLSASSVLNVPVPEPSRCRAGLSSSRFALEEWWEVGGNLLPVNQTAGIRLLFITGTDTGVGKTVLTSLLLNHLRRLKVPALAIKPFCCGSRADAQLLHDVQQGDITLDEVNPFYFSEPLAPLVAARKQTRSIGLPRVLAHIHSIARRLPRFEVQSKESETRHPVLLIEGAGGLLVPLGPQYFVLDLIQKLRCEVIVVSRNKLGTLNHTMLTIQALKNGCLQAGINRFARSNESSSAHYWRPKVVLMQQKQDDLSAASNSATLSELLAPVPLWKLPFFAGTLQFPAVIQKIEKKIEKTLAQILD
jgi:dethiobiotin synthetase